MRRFEREPLSFASQGFDAKGNGWKPAPTYIHYVSQTGDIWMVGFMTGFSVLHLTSTAGPLPVPAVRAARSFNSEKRR